VAIALLVLLPAAVAAQKDWRSYGQDPGGTRYSSLTQIAPTNVARLTRAWTYDTGEPANAFQTTPLVIDGLMYLSTPAQRIVALDAATGREVWKYDPGNKRPGTHRGVSYWPGSGGATPRIFFATGDNRLLALDARSGRPVTTFGQDGAVDLRAGVAENFPDALFYVSSPPAIYKNLVILGPRTAESAPNAKGPAGDIRAFDAVTGKLMWSFHTLPRPGEPGYETWGPNFWRDGSGPSAWAGITVDQERGVVFVPTGQPSGGGPPENRVGINLYANCVLALDAATGKLKWYFQTVHHDQWDYDVPAPPALIDVVKEGERIPAVAQITKQGMLFILERATGKPIFGVEERPVPAGDPGEGTWPTQPFPIKPAPISRNTLRADEVSRISPEAERYCTEALGGADLVPYALTSPSFPSSIGGGNWGGVAFDPNLGLIFVNTSELGRAPRARGGRGAARGGGPGRGLGRGGPVGIPGQPASNRFVDPDYLPCNAPPWGLLTAVNANTGDVAWRVPLGSYRELEEKGVKNTGAPNLGGPIVTASGLVFIGATNDRRFRAFDAKTGKELWVEDMPGQAMATPITYVAGDGKQYVAVATGGPGLLASVFPRGPADVNGTIVAFSLPR
jgi:quinoprotein glucose dehydrogenase